MGEEGAVSMWLGKAVDSSSFSAATKLRHSRDGDFLGSEFCEAFGIGFYDEDFAEMEFLEPAKGDARSTLRDASYGEVIEERFREAMGSVPGTWNCLVLLYNFRYAGTRESWVGVGLELRYVGAVSYRR